METQNLVVERTEARALYRKYREHQHYAKPIDWEIQRTYQLIAQGRVVIRAIDSIIKAGLNGQYLPRLALVRADATQCFWVPNTVGGGTFSMDRWTRGNAARSRRIQIPDNSWPGTVPTGYRYEALVPLVPIHIRPKRGLENYHVLWEAEWTRQVPVDPMLLRRVGQADLWVVVAAWDLTEVERAALARIS
jgi:hypothetical protein